MGRRSSPIERQRDRPDLSLLAGLGLALLVFFLSPYIWHGFGSPFGPDAPVYLWWMRVGGAQGLSVVGGRPGSPALMLTLAGALHLSPAAVVAGMECVLGTCVGLGSAALAKAAGAKRTGWILAGILGGTFAVFLAAGYLSNLTFAVAFLGAAAVLGERPSARSTIAAAGLLAGGGLSHPQFFILGSGILGTVAVWGYLVRSERGPRDEPARIFEAIFAAGLLVAAGVLAALAGPPHLAADTSRDAFLRRAGLAGPLRDAFRHRFFHEWRRYMEVVSIPLALFGLSRTRSSTAGRTLRAWVVVTAAGIPVGLLTGLFPAERLLTFAFAVPILAALGLTALTDRLRRKGMRVAVVCGLTAAMTVPAMWVWYGNDPWINDEPLREMTIANRLISATSPGTLIVFDIEPGFATPTFLVVLWANQIRASVPPERAGDVYFSLAPAAPNGDTSEERRRMSALAAAEIARAEAVAGPALRIQLLAFSGPAHAEPGAEHPGREIAPGVWAIADAPVPAAAPTDPLLPSSGPGIALAALSMLALLMAAGYGWARSVIADHAWTVALSPAFGIAALTIAGLTSERFGVPLNGAVGPTVVALLAGGGGYVVRFVLKRRAGTDPAA